MLILTRKVGEDIKVGDDVTVTVVAIDRNKVRLGVAAPRETSVHRGEVYNRIKKGMTDGNS